MWVRLHATLSGLVTPVLVAASAVGQSGSIHVTRAAEAEDCPDTAALTARVAAARGPAAAGPPLRVAFSHDQDTYWARVTTEEAQPRTRHLHDRADSCEGLARATTVVLALMLDAAETRAETTPTPPAAARPREPEPARPRQRARGFLASAGSGVAFNVVRPAAPAVVGTLVFETGPWSFGVGGLWIPSQTLDVTPGTVTVALLSGGPSACLSTSSTLRLGACVGLLGGTLSASSSGYDLNEAKTRPWLAATGGATVSVPVSVLQIALGARALVPSRREAFAVEGAGVAWEPAPVGALLALELGVRIPP